MERGLWFPYGKKAIGCKSIFKVKENPNGTINKYKARLVAKGFHQIAGFDFTGTFFLVVKPPTIRVVLTVAFMTGWNVRQLDMNNAFLNGDVQEEMFMDQPQGGSLIQRIQLMSAGCTSPYMVSNKL